MHNQDLDPYIAYTSRIKNAFNPEFNGKLLPIACTTVVFRNNIKDLTNYVVSALKMGAGVNVHLDYLDDFEPILDTDLDSVCVLYCINGSPVLHYMGGRKIENKNYAATFDELVYVKDSLWDDPSEDGNLSICDAVAYAYDAVRTGKTVCFDLQNLTDKGQKTKANQVASGAESFASLFASVAKLAASSKTNVCQNLLGFLSNINETIRKGGLYKNGAVTTTYPVWGNHILDYLVLPTHLHPWLKKSVVVNRGFDNPTITDLIIKKYNKNSLWIEKCLDLDNIFSDKWLNPDERLLFNVCREILLIDKGSCMVLPLNLGMITRPYQIPKAMCYGMEVLCNLHEQDFQNKSKIYRSVTEDRQVGLGFIGLANMLALHDVIYDDFVVEFEFYVNNYIGYGELNDFPPTDVKTELAYYLVLGYINSAEIAKSKNMVRAFAIAPTASVSFAHQDIRGYTTCPEISLPFAKTVERVSSLGNNTYDYPDNVETATPENFEYYWRLADSIQKLTDYLGLGHSISFNMHVDLNKEYLEKFMNSNLRALYYKFELDQTYLDKNVMNGGSNGITCNCG